ncbi:MAG: aminoacyl-histidine dipeptidase [Marinilabiliaceae bacterium]|jgi:dipeptidase D|nr:aminoacyl-histidine dipeptidase [Marinilabiliaceae bacterium]
MFISHLEPSSLWKYFESICKIPRLSKNEEKIRAFLKEFAQKNRLDVKEDKVGNILITRQADTGYENRKAVVLQSHMDMVGEKNADTVHNWASDPIKPFIEDGWVTAKVTTLGADDGIGMAAQMAILTDKSFKTGKIECLFTVDEESGMTGAINLQKDFFTSDILINLDSEDEGELFIGCAGGIDTVAEFNVETEKCSGEGMAYEISVTGLHGGHSGDEIHNGYANAVKLIAETISAFKNIFDARLSFIDAGNLRNAIPREAFARLVAKNLSEKEAGKIIGEYQDRFAAEYEATEPNLKLDIKTCNLPETVIKSNIQSDLINSLLKCPHGVIAWSKSMDNLVETSTNLASVKMKDNKITIVTSQRSSVNSAKNELALRIEKVFEEAGAKVRHSDGYPGWEPDTNSQILNITRSSYTRLFGEKPLVRAIHAGLECGLILEKYPGLDMISFGPTIKGAHTPEERINIVTTLKFWDLLVDVLKNIPEKE